MGERPACTLDRARVWGLLVDSTESFLRWHEARSPNPDEDITIIMERAAVSAGRAAIAALTQEPKP